MDDDPGAGPMETVRRVAGIVVAVPAVVGFVALGIIVLAGRAALDVGERALRSLTRARGGDRDDDR
jgi:hypothetical protein